MVCGLAFFHWSKRISACRAASNFRSFTPRALAICNHLAMTSPANRSLPRSTNVGSSCSACTVAAMFTPLPPLPGTCRYCVFQFEGAIRAQLEREIPVFSPDCHVVRYTDVAFLIALVAADYLILVHLPTPSAHALTISPNHRCLGYVSSFCCSRISASAISLSCAASTSQRQRVIPIVYKDGSVRIRTQETYSLSDVVGCLYRLLSRQRIAQLGGRGTERDDFVGYFHTFIRLSESSYAASRTSIGVRPSNSSFRFPDSNTSQPIFLVHA